LKTRSKILLCFMLIAFLDFLAAPGPAQTFTTLHTFIGPEGASPYGGLVLSGNTLYGTTFEGGAGACGTVFSVKIDGTDFKTLHSFSALSGGSSGTNDDGANSTASLILSQNMLYGTTQYGGVWSNGTLFALKTDGTGFSTLHSFTPLSNGYSGTNSDGANPEGGLILSGNTLFGTAFNGGSAAHGTVFSLKMDGTGFTTLYNFNNNSDGASPLGDLVLSGDTLFGTTVQGSNSVLGSVFSLSTQGTRFKALHAFTGGSDGANPMAGLVLSSNTLYGTAYFGGAWGVGTVFALRDDGSDFRVLHSFDHTDGISPWGGLVLSNDTLYGTAFYGGYAGNGTVFSLKTNAAAFTVLHTFTALSSRFFGTNTDGVGPIASLLLSSNTLYGSCAGGGGLTKGTLFSISFAPNQPPQLSIARLGENIILSWPTNSDGLDYTGSILQSNTNLASPATWTRVSPPPVVLNGRFTASNPVSGAQQFYRLTQ